MQVSFILPSLPRQISGGTKIIFEYANYLVEKGDDVTIYYMVDKCLNKYCIPKIIGMEFGRIVAFRYPKWIKLSNKIQIKGVYLANQVAKGDIVIATAIRTSFFVKSLSHTCGKKAYFIQGFENWSFSDEEVYQSYQLGMSNIVIARWLKDIVEQKSGQEAFYVSNGIDNNIFFAVNPVKKRKSHTIAFHYRSETIKGATYAIEVIKKIKNKYCDTEVYVIGREERPKELPQWCQYIKNASAQEVAKIDNEVEVFLCTSVSEGFGLPGLEAMACGCALVTTNYLGAMEYAVHGKNSLVEPVKDIEGLTDAVSRLFDDDELRGRISKEAILTGREYSFRNSAIKFRNILIEICERDK